LPVVGFAHGTGPNVRAEQQRFRASGHQEQNALGERNACEFAVFSEL
jgi:hypothetical protein